MDKCLFCELPILQKASWRKFIQGKSMDIICLNCKGKLHYSTEEHAIYFYNDFMKEILHKFKFQQDIRVANFFAEALIKKLKTYEYDVIMPIPMHPVMEEKRTFAHMDEILKAANIPFEQYLVKLTEKQQSKKTKLEREKISQLFGLTTKIKDTKQRILIVDDLITTGSTLKYATEILNKAGSLKIDTLVLISARK